MAQRFKAEQLTAYAAALLGGVGYGQEMAQVTATHLLAADLMGHTTHGLALLPAYLAEAEAGRTKTSGTPQVLVDGGAVAVWDGHYLPGVWLTATAVAAAVDAARQHGVGIVSVRRSGHIGCLATFLEAATSQGMLAIVTCSDPSVESVAPYGGTRAAYTPNPIAVGIPTDADPVLIDISASITTNGMAARMAQRGERFPGKWLQDASGNPTDDPRAMTPAAFGKTGDATGTILPVGGVDHGHKGFGLGLIVEALTQGLSGHGRGDGADQWGAGVFVQVLDGAAFAGPGELARVAGYLVEQCRASPAAPWSDGVRIPGERALATRAAAEASGIELHTGIFVALAPWAEKLQVEPPAPAP